MVTSLRHSPSEGLRKPSDTLNLSKTRLGSLKQKAPSSLLHKSGSYKAMGFLWPPLIPHPTHTPTWLFFPGQEQFLLLRAGHMKHPRNCLALWLLPRRTLQVAMESTSEKAPNPSVLTLLAERLLAQVPCQSIGQSIG